VRAGWAFCYQCDQARRTVPGLVADAVAPIAYAAKGGELARDLRLYKSDVTGAAAAGARLGRLLGSFLREHGPAVWAAAGMAAGPTAVAVVPSGQGRLAPHPLESVVAGTVRLPAIRLGIRPEEAAHGRSVSTDWLRVVGRAGGEDVLLIDDTWVSGASAQSAAAALKLAGACRVAVIVIGRHVDPADPKSADLVRAINPARVRQVPARPAPGAASACDRRFRP
jgi:hypothetical protein